MAARRYTQMQIANAMRGVPEEHWPDADGLAEDERMYEDHARRRRLGLIRPGRMLVDGPLCEEHPVPQLSACVRMEDHAGACVFARLLPDGRGAEFYRTTSGQPTPLRRHGTFYVNPTRAELAEEWAALEVFLPHIVPPLIAEPDTVELKAAA